MRENRSRSGGCTREAHVGRTEVKNKRDLNEERKVKEILDAVNSIRESDPNSYGQSIKSSLKDK